MALTATSKAFGMDCCTPAKPTGFGSCDPGMWEALDTSELPWPAKEGCEQDTSSECLIEGQHHATNSSCTYMDEDPFIHTGPACHADRASHAHCTAEVHMLLSPSHVSCNTAGAPALFTEPPFGTAAPQPAVSEAMTEPGGRTPPTRPPPPFSPAPAPEASVKAAPPAALLQETFSTRPSPPPPPPPPPLGKASSSYQPSTPPPPAPAELPPQGSPDQAACPAPSQFTSDEAAFASAAAAAAAAAAVVAGEAPDPTPCVSALDGAEADIVAAAVAAASAAAALGTDDAPELSPWVFLLSGLGAPALQDGGLAAVCEWAEPEDWVTQQTVEFPAEGPAPAAVPVAFIAGHFKELSMPLSVLHTLAFTEKSGSSVVRSHSCVKRRASEAGGVFQVNSSEVIHQLRDMGFASAHTSSMCFVTLSAAAAVMQQLGHPQAVVDAVNSMHLQANLSFLAAHMQAQLQSEAGQGVACGGTQAAVPEGTGTGGAGTQETPHDNVPNPTGMMAGAAAGKSGHSCGARPRSRKRKREAIPSPVTPCRRLPPLHRFGSLREIYAGFGVVLGRGQQEAQPAPDLGVTPAQQVPGQCTSGHQAGGCQAPIPTTGCTMGPGTAAQSGTAHGDPLDTPTKRMKVSVTRRLSARSSNTLQLPQQLTNNSCQQQHCHSKQQAMRPALVSEGRAQGCQPSQPQLSRALQVAITKRNNNAEVLFLAADELLCDGIDDQNSVNAEVVLAASPQLPQILAMRVIPLRLLLKHGRLDQARKLLQQVVQRAGADGAGEHSV